VWDEKAIAYSRWRGLRHVGESHPLRQVAKKSHRKVAFFIPRRFRGAGRLRALRVG
jgi:hypothetical protein